MSAGDAAGTGDGFFAAHAAELAANGYHPVPIIPGEKRPAKPDWRNSFFAPGDERRFPGCGVGIVTNGLAALDLDIRDEVLARKVRDAVLAVYPDAAFAPERIGNAPKALILLRSTGTFRKRATGKWRLPDGSTAEVEILATGQQFVAFHIHPDTGKPYEWPGDSPLDVPAGELPAITETERDAIVEAVCEVFRREHLEPPQRATGAREGTGDGGGEVTRDAVSGLVTNRREYHLTLLVWSAFQERRDALTGEALVEEVANDAWATFVDTTDLTRPRSDGRPWSFDDAMAKARAAVRRHASGQTQMVAVRPTHPKIEGSVDGAFFEAAAACRQFFDTAVIPFHRAMTMRAAGVPFCVGGVPIGIAVPTPIAPLHGILATTGVGKTTAALGIIVDDLSANPGAVGAFLVQTHVLAEEIAHKANDLSNGRISIRVYRGIDRADADQPGKTMCQRPAAAKAWTAAGGTVARLCEACPSNGMCGTSRQRQATADLWIVPSNMLFGDLPECIPAGRLRWVIVDEDPTQYATAGGDAGTEAAPKTELLAIDEATEARPIPDWNDRRKTDHDLTADYAAAADVLRLALSQGGNRLTTAALVQNGMTVQLAEAAEQATRRLRTFPEASGDMDDAAIIAAAESRVEGHNTVRRLTALWRAIRQAISAGTEYVPGIVRTRVNTPGGRVAMLDMMWRRPVDASWRVPTLIMDATAQRVLVEAVFGRDVSAWTEAHAALTNNVRVRQVWDASFGLSMLAPQDGAGVSAHNAANSNIRKLFWYIEVRASHFRGHGAVLDDGARPDVLVLAQKKVAERLRALGLPPNVEIEHFGNFAGRDRWCGVRCIIVIGRRLIPPRAAERIAEVLGNRDVVPVNDKWYETVTAGLRMRGTETGHAVEVERHADPFAEAYRWRVGEGEIVQGIGRARGVRRTCDTPLQIDILGRLPLPGIEVDELLAWRDASSPSVSDHVLARSGFVLPPTTPPGLSDMVAELLPDRFGNGKAVRDYLFAKGNRSLSDSSNRKILEDSDTETLTRNRYKLDAKSRYSVELVRIEDDTPLPFVDVGTRVTERRTYTILTGYSWRPVDEVRAEEWRAAARWAAARPAGVASWPSWFQEP